MFMRLALSVRIPALIRASFYFFPEKQFKGPAFEFIPVDFPGLWLDLDAIMLVHTQGFA